MRNQESSFNVGLLHRNYAQQDTDTPPARDAEQNSGWTVTPKPLPLSVLRHTTEDAGHSAHEKRLAALSSPSHVDALKAVVGALAEGDKRHAKAAQEIYWTNSIPVIALNHSGGDMSVIAGTSRARLNPLQMLETAAKYKAAYSSVVEESLAARPLARFSLITFTIRHTDGLPLATALDVVTKAFSALNRSKLWKTTVKHSVRGIETPWSRENGWHVHVHVFAECGVFNIPDLHAAWCDRLLKAASKVNRAGLEKLVRWIDGGKRGEAPYVLDPDDFGLLLPILEGVDVRECQSPAEAVGYVAKMELLKELPAPQIRELFDALKGRKLVRGSKEWGKRAKAFEQEAKEKRDELEEESGVERIVIADLRKDIGQGACIDTAKRVAQACYDLGFHKMASILGDLIQASQRVHPERKAKPAYEPTGLERYDRLKREGKAASGRIKLAAEIRASIATKAEHQKAISEILNRDPLEDFKIQ